MDSPQGTMHADVLIVGGGLVGLASALSAARAGATVICVEADYVGARQSSQNWGFVRKQGRAMAEVPLMLDSITRWEHLSDDLGVDVNWVQSGNVAVFETEAQEAGYRQWLASTQPLGVDSTVIDGSEIKSIVGGWRGQALGALFSPTDGHSEPAAVLAAYASACSAAGVTVIENCEVLRLLTHGSSVVGAETACGIVWAAKTVVAAGDAMRKILDSVGVDFPQGFVTGTVALTSPVAPITDASVWGPGYSFRQRKDGRVICSVGGGGVVRVDPDTVAQSAKFLPAFRKNWRRFSVRPSMRLATELPRVLQGRSALRTSGPPTPRVRSSEPVRALRELQHRLHGLEHAQIEHAWAGVIDSTPDGNPVIDPATGIGGLIVVGGFSGHGYGLVPTIGAIIGDLLDTGQTEFDLTPFGLGRFAARSFKAPDAVL